MQIVQSVGQCQPLTQLLFVPLRSCYDSFMQQTTWLCCRFVWCNCPLENSWQTHTVCLSLFSKDHPELEVESRLSNKGRPHSTNQWFPNAPSEVLWHFISRQIFKWRSGCFESDLYPQGDLQRCWVLLNQKSTTPKDTERETKGCGGKERSRQEKNQSDAVNRKEDVRQGKRWKRRK